MTKGTKSAWVAAALAVAVAGGATVRAVADDKTAPSATPTSQPATAHTTGRHKLTEPWDEMKTLTPEQTQQIEKIHADALEQEKKIRDKERDDIDALLKPEQLKEVDAILAAKKEAAKEKAAAKHMATTKPTK